MIGDSNNETNFPHRVSRLRKAFANASSANMRLSKVQLSKTV